MLGAPNSAGRLTNAVVAESRRLREMIERERAQFILNDLKMGMTFLSIARTTLNPETARRNVANAQRAFDMVLHQISKLHAGPHEMREIKTHFELLRQELREFEQPMFYSRSDLLSPDES